METRYVTLINRTSKDLVGRYDGRQHTIPAGSRTQWPEHLAYKFKEQNPLMGSENYYDFQKQYLLAIEEYGDDATPIEQSEKQTLLNFESIVIPSGVKLEVLPGRPGNPRTDFGAKPSPQIVGFEANDVPVGGKVEVVELPPAPAFEKP